MRHAADLHAHACAAAARSTVRVWADGKCAEVLEGHEGAVQAVLFLPSGEIISGSNDNTIRVWAGGRCQHTIAGHSDTVRCALSILQDS
jgi:phospholipase A-2-activating protein